MTTPALPPAPTQNAIKDLAKKALLFVAIFCWFRYVGDLSREHSALLTVVCGVLALSVYTASQERKRERMFSPFWISIRADWRAILLDFKILDEQRCDALREQHNSITAVPGERPYHVLLDGVTFTVLKPDLVYWDNRSCFLGSADLEIQIPEITGNVRSMHAGEYHARFRVRAGQTGYEFGIKTAESVQRALDNRDEDRSSEIGLIRIATLPYWQFWLCYSGLKRTDRTERQMVQAFREHGWEEKKRDPELWGWPIKLRHKYFWVEHRGLHW